MTTLRMHIAPSAVSPGHYVVALGVDGLGASEGASALGKLRGTLSHGGPHYIVPLGRNITLGELEYRADGLRADWDAYRCRYGYDIEIRDGLFATQEKV